MAARLSKAKRDIDDERQRRQAVEAHMLGAKRNSEAMVAELGDKFTAQQQKEAELVAKLKKLESNKNKYKESASDNKRKMRQLKEEHEQRLNELENDIILTLNDQLREEKRKAAAQEGKLHVAQQQAMSAQQQAQAAMANVHKLEQRLGPRAGAQQRVVSVCALFGDAAAAVAHQDAV